MSTHFFLSYAHSDRDPYLWDFFKRLSREVRLISGDAGERMGFIDGFNIELGQQWSNTLASALNESRILLPLYTPTYFQRGMCGAEWMAFRMRQELHMKVFGQDKPPPVILPILWVPERHLPPLPYVARHIQYSHASLGPNYVEQGVRQLSKLRKYRDQYEHVLTGLAEMIVRVGERVNLLAHPEFPAMEQMQNAFAIPDPNAPAPPDPHLQSQTYGPRYTKFVYVAAPAHEIAGSRRSAASYGAGGHEWQPYRPPVQEEVAIIAQLVTASQGLHYGAIPMNGRVVEEIEAAHQNRNMVLFIVDPWTLRLETYHRQMRDIDAREGLQYVVLIPSNIHDEETAAARDALEAALRTAFPRRSGDSGFFVGPIGSTDEFRAQLALILENLRSRLMSEAPPLKTGNDVQDRSLPIVSSSQEPGS
jgi:FxsC-like protein